MTCLASPSVHKQRASPTDIPIQGSECGRSPQGRTFSQLVLHPLELSTSKLGQLAACVASFFLHLFSFGLVRYLCTENRSPEVAFLPPAPPSAGPLSQATPIGSHPNALKPADKPATSVRSYVTSLFYEQSVLLAMNNQDIQERLHRYKDLSCTQKLHMGAIMGVNSVLVALLLLTSIDWALSGMPSGKKATVGFPCLYEVCAAAVSEEVLFRGIMQNGLAGAQKLATHVTPQCAQNNRVFQWLTSPSARIIMINALFAGSHLSNGGDYLSEKDSLQQAIKIFLKPTYGILHETTGNILAPIAAHVANNCVAWLIRPMLR